MAERLAGRQMLEITSVSNAKVKETVKLHQKKYRTESGLFLIEGYKPVHEAFLEKVEIETVFTTAKHLEKFEFVKDKIVLVTDAVIEKLSTTDSACEAVAVAKQVNISLEDIKNKTRIALLENTKDAGNLGTLMRSAAAFKIDAIVLCGDTIDPYNPKVVRSTVGGLFKVPFVKADLAKVKETFKNHNFIATVVNHKDVVELQTIDYTNPFVIMLGSEADGLTPEAVDVANIKTTIPISKSTESLNLSVAGSILFYISAQV